MNVQEIKVEFYNQLVGLADTLQEQKLITHVQRDSILWKVNLFRDFSISAFHATFSPHEALIMQKNIDIIPKLEGLTIHFFQDMQMKYQDLPFTIQNIVMQFIFILYSLSKQYYEALNQ